MGEHLIDVHVALNPARAHLHDRLLKSLSGEPINLYITPYHEDDVSRVRQEGFTKGTAPWVSYVDDDDYIEPGIFRKFTEYVTAIKSHIEKENITGFWTLENERDEDLNLIKVNGGSKQFRFPDDYFWRGGVDPIVTRGMSPDNTGTAPLDPPFINHLLILKRELTEKAVEELAKFRIPEGLRPMEGIPSEFTPYSVKCPEAFIIGYHMLYGGMAMFKQVGYNWVRYKDMPTVTNSTDMENQTILVLKYLYDNFCGVNNPYGYIRYRPIVSGKVFRAEN